MDKSNLSLFLGMLVGDGYISNRNNGFGYPTYSINFYNTSKELVDLFYKLHFLLFSEEGKINSRVRKNRKRIYEFSMYSKKSFYFLVNDIGIPCGKKAKIVRVPDFVMNSNNEIKKKFFLGLFLTDGGISNRGIINFHMASKELLLGISTIIKSIWGFERSVKSIIQKEKYFSYQLTLKKKESSQVLNSIMPGSHNLVLH